VVGRKPPSAHGEAAVLEGLLRLISIGRPAAELLRDFVDILIVAFIVYRALLVLKGTRAMQMGIGFVAFSALYLVAKFAQLATLISVLSWLGSSAILIVVVVFQNDIRRALIRVGSKAWLTRGPDAQERVIDEVCAAATELARHRMGAIIALERDADVGEFVQSKGIEIDSVVTKELLVSLFIPEAVNKTHDGAVLIGNHRINRAGVFFQMPEEAKIEDPTLGSRHRAAIGITERTDALLIVVSEERGTITLFFNTNSVLHLNADNLREALFGLFGRPESRPRFIDRVTSGLTRRATRTADRAIDQKDRADSRGKASAAKGATTAKSSGSKASSVKASSVKATSVKATSVKASGSKISKGGDKNDKPISTKASSRVSRDAVRTSRPPPPNEKPTIKSSASGAIKPTKQSGRFRALKAPNDDELPKQLPRVSVPMPSSTDKINLPEVLPSFEDDGDPESPEPPPAVSKPMTPTELPTTILRGSDDT
jgi:diadenylate cyclase